MADMSRIVGVVISITVAVIVISSVLAPEVATVTGSGGALAEYKGLVTSLLIMCIVGSLMVAVRLVSNKN